MPKVSVIVPVYNGEEHLRQCLDSICGQTLSDIEIICVDDGSTDQSFKILEEYKEIDKRFRTLRQKNQYAGAARNYGIREATGEYLMFWDCDDFFDSTALEKLYSRAEETQADICVCGANQYFTRLKKTLPTHNYLDIRKIPDADVFNRKTNEAYILNFSTAAVWNKLYRRSFVEKEGITFQEIHNGNDVFFVIVSLCLAERVSIVNEALVTYRKNQESSTVGRRIQAPYASIEAWVNTRKFLEENDILPEQSFYNRMMRNIVYALRTLPQHDAFVAAVDYMHREGIEGLHICKHPKDYYYTSWHEEFVHHLLNDTAVELWEYIDHFNYIQLTEQTGQKEKNAEKYEKQKKKNEALKEKNEALKEKNEALKEKNKNLKEDYNSEREKAKMLKAKIKEKDKELTSIKNSASYRIGRLLTWPARKAKSILKILK